MSLIQIRQAHDRNWLKTDLAMSQRTAPRADFCPSPGKVKLWIKARRMEQGQIDGMMPSEALAMAMVALAALPQRVEAAQQPLEGGEDPAFGTVRWRTLFCADRTQTNGVVMGIAEFAPGGTLLPHRHAPAEVYFGLEGSAVVTVDGLPQPMGPGTALFVPADAEHGTVAGPDGFRMLYVFPRDRFAEVEYRFSPL